MSERDMIREAVKGFLKPIIAEVMAEVAAQPTMIDGTRYYTREEAQEHLMSRLRNRGYECTFYRAPWLR